VTDQAWETLSNQAIAAAGLVYFLSLLAYLVQWASLRNVPVATAERVAVGAGGSGVDTPDRPVEPAQSQRAELTGRLALLLAGLGCVLQLVALVGRGMAADPNRGPWGNMYEFTLSGTFWIAVLFLVALRPLSLAWMAPVVVGVVLSLLMLGVLVLYAPISPLTEALNSPWLVIHVVAAIIATATFTLGGISSVLYLLKTRQGASTTGFLARVPAPADLDRLSYRLHSFAFPVWTFAVLIAGPIWAYYAWSRYWGWDPKEVWALITWVVYAAYLHARATAGWRGRKAAWLALVGVATLWFNFVGINYFSSTSQHSYAAPAVTEGADETAVEASSG
jgi:cytochrome c-type biogenesis protein CcsB